VSRKRLAAVGALAIALVVLTFSGFGRDKTRQGQYVTAPVERTDLSTTVSANGTLEALQTVQVGSQISGQVAEIHADYNSIVK
jgi:HlyD family secretion protein